MTCRPSLCGRLGAMIRLDALNAWGSANISHALAGHVPRGVCAALLKTPGNLFFFSVRCGSLSVGATDSPRVPLNITKKNQRGPGEGGDLSHGLVEGPRGGAEGSVIKIGGGLQGGDVGVMCVRPMWEMIDATETPDMYAGSIRSVFTAPVIKMLYSPDFQRFFRYLPHHLLKTHRFHWAHVFFHRPCWLLNQVRA